MKDKNHIIPVYAFAEYVWPVYTCIDHLGKTHRLRKYISMGGSQGVADEKAIHSILPEKPEYKRIFIDVYLESLIVGAVIDKQTVWLAFSLSGEPIFSGNQFETLEEIQQKLKERRNSWSQSD